VVNSLIQLQGNNVNYDNLGLSFEWYEAKDRSRAGWFVNATFSVNPTDLGGVHVGSGRLEGVFETWPDKGVYGISQSFAGNFAFGSVEHTSSPDGSYVW